MRRRELRLLHAPDLFLLPCQSELNENLLKWGTDWNTQRDGKQDSMGRNMRIKRVTWGVFFDSHFSNVFLLLLLQGELNEDLLQLLVAVVDDKLLKTVVLQQANLTINRSTSPLRQPLINHLSFNPPLINQPYPT